MKKKKNRSAKEKQNSSFLSNFIFKALVLLGLLALFFIFYKLSRQVYRQKEINEEITALQEEIDRLNQNNSKLEQLSDYFQTDHYKEKEAREKLGLIKEGERIVEIKEKEIPTKEKTQEQKPEIKINKPNYYYWWHYFFNIE